jgi:hypothetical protein
MLLTMHLSVTETMNYAALRSALRGTALKLARKNGRRFVQVVGSDGRIRDIIEAA